MAIEPFGESAFWVFRKSVSSAFFVSASSLSGLVVVGVVDVTCLKTKLGRSSGLPEGAGIFAVIGQVKRGFAMLGSS